MSQEASLAGASLRLPQHRCAASLWKEPLKGHFLSALEVRGSSLAPSLFLPCLAEPRGESQSGVGPGARAVTLSSCEPSWCVLDP